MPEKTKVYRSFTGLKEFYYGEVNESDTGIVGLAPERIKFLQDIGVETAQEIVRAFGDNGVAELAVGNGSTTLSTSFHAIPIEDQTRLYGLRKLGGLVAHTPNNKPPYVACAFARTAENGGTEWLGLAKGMFTMPNEEGKTKEESVEFSSMETSGEFMPRTVTAVGETLDVTYLKGYDAPGETTNRDALFQAIFGVNHPEYVEPVPGV